MAGHFFSENPDKAWAEKYFLIYSPFWMIAIGLVMLLGLDEQLNDIGFILLGVFIMAPYFIFPALKSPENERTIWFNTYWFKSNAYIFIFSVFGNYFGSEYFFDVLGMVYHYPSITWNLDSKLLGEGSKQVPILMYLLTHAYFMTYHVTATIVLRKLNTLQLPLRKLLFPIFVFIIGYSWAWIETKAMANSLIADSFHYEKMDKMLAFGSAIYAIYFLVSFPIFYYLDESTNHHWSLHQTIAAALSASMLTFFGLDIAAHWVGTL